MAQVIAAALESAVEGLHVSMPGVVTAWHASDQSVDVQPAIKVPYFDEQGTRQTKALPIVPHVPVLFPGSGSVYMAFAINVGDPIMLLFADRSIDTWLALGGSDVEPADDSAHALSDAFAIPGLQPLATPRASFPTDGAAIVSDNLQLGEVGASDPVARKSDLDAIKAAINGAAVAGTDGGAALKANIIAAWPSSVGSAKVRVD